MSLPPPSLEDHGPSCIRDVLDYALDADGVLVEENHPLVAFLRDNPGAVAGHPFDVDKAKRWIRLDRALVSLCEDLRRPSDVSSPPVTS